MCIIPTFSTTAVYVIKEVMSADSGVPKKGGTGTLQVPSLSCSAFPIRKKSGPNRTVMGWLRLQIYPTWVDKRRGANTLCTNI